MSPATRRRASARWSRWATSSERRAAATIDADRGGDLDRRSGSSGPRSPSGRPRGRARPTGRSTPGIAIAISGRRRRRRRRRRAVALDRARDRRRRRDRARRRARRTSAAARRTGGSVGAALARGNEALAAELVDRRRPEVAALADDQRRLAQNIVERPGSPAIRPSADSVPRSARRRSARDRSGRASRPVASCGGGGAVAGDRPGRPGRGLRRVLGRGEEALEIAEPVAAVAARVDPVVAQAAGVAPGPDRVRMHAEQAGGLRHREGGIDRTGGERARQRVSHGGNVKSTAAAYQSHSSCQ